MILQRDDGFLLKENRIGRAAGGLSPGARAAGRGRGVPQDRAIQRHRLGLRLGALAHDSVSTTIRAARSTSARVTSRWVTARSRRGPYGASRTPAWASRAAAS